MIYQDFLELLRVLEKHKVKYALIGGYAVGIYAEPRYTKDMDIVVAPTLKNARALLLALEEFGAPISNLSKEDIAKPGLLYVFGVEPLRVDILNRIKGVSVALLIKRSKKIKIKKISASVVSLSDLIKLKQLAGRKQDLADIDNLKLAEKRLRSKKK